MESHTFVAAYEDFALTLEDVLDIMSLPLYGDSGVLDSTLIEEDMKRVQQLTKVASSHSSYTSWVHYFSACEGSRSGLALEAMLA